MLELRRLSRGYRDLPLESPRKYCGIFGVPRRSSSVSGIIVWSVRQVTEIQDNKFASIEAMPRKTWPAFLLCVLVRFAKVDGKSLIAKKPLKWLDVDVNGKLGTWSAWDAWSTCSEKTCCRHGLTLRRRSCANEPCTGIESEATDCPKTDCKVCSSGPLADTALAATGSFINLECETSEKYSASGNFSWFIPSSLYVEFPALKSALRSGFFGIQHLVDSFGKRKNKQKMMMRKFCFEPTMRLTFRQARRVFQSNKRVKLPSPKRLSRQETVNAIVITTKPNGELFYPGIYFTVARQDGLTAFYRHYGY